MFVVDSVHEYSFIHNFLFFVMEKEEDPTPPGIVEEVFYKEVEWTPFSFGNDTTKEQKDYDKACPSGGPGGLVCCQHCAEEYTWYLSRTVKDMETHRTSRVGKEVQELLKFLKQGRTTLENAYNVAKKKVPPLPPKIPAPNHHATNPRPTSSSSSRKHNHSSVPLEPTQWNMTSTIDIAQSTVPTAMQV